MMHDEGKSDTPVVGAKSSNKDGATLSAEAMERRGVAEGNRVQQNASRTQSRTSAPSALDRVREVAKKDRGATTTGPQTRSSVTPASVPCSTTTIGRPREPRVGRVEFSDTTGCRRLALPKAARLTAGAKRAPNIAREKACHHTPHGSGVSCPEASPEPLWPPRAYSTSVSLGYASEERRCHRHGFATVGQPCGEAERSRFTNGDVMYKARDGLGPRPAYADPSTSW